jgi:hypothetical protein
MDAHESGETSAAEETKRKFREALEAKKQNGTRRVGPGGGDSGVHGVRGKAGNKREFRRKSG